MENKIQLAFLELLVCPISREPLVLNAEGTCLIAEQSGQNYPIEDGIPVLISDFAVPGEQK